MHYLYEPKDNQWWEKAKQFVELIKYHSLPDIVYYCNDKKVWRVEHQSDIFRLLVLKQHGGVYADVDTLFYKPFFHLNVVSVYVAEGVVDACWLLIFVVAIDPALD